MHHRKREPVSPQHPVHVTLRVRPGVPSLRDAAFLAEWRRSLTEGKERSGFRVVHYRLQHQHVQLIVEAASRQALSRGMKSIGARLGRAVNRTFERSGPVLDGRYETHVLRTPAEVRGALAWVLLGSGSQRRSPPSSARWFDGWAEDVAGSRDTGAEREVAEPHSLLLRRGWRRHGLVDPGETAAPPDPTKPLASTAVKPDA